MRLLVQVAACIHPFLQGTLHSPLLTLFCPTLSPLLASWPWGTTSTGGEAVAWRPLGANPLVKRAVPAPWAPNRHLHCCRRSLFCCCRTFHSLAPGGVGKPGAPPTSGELQSHVSHKGTQEEPFGTSRADLDSWTLWASADPWPEVSAWAGRHSG